MNILFDNQIFGAQKYGGVSRYHVELAKQFSNKFNDQVEIVAWFNKNVYLAEYFKKKPLDISNDRVSSCANRLNTINTFLKVNCKKCDVIHITWYNPKIVDICTKKPLIITVHDMIQEIFSFSPTDVKHKKYAMQKADGIIAISENTKQDILKLYPEIQEDKITVIYHGTNHLAQPVCPSGFPLPEKYLLYVGSRYKYKNAKLLMKAAAQHLLTNTDLHLLFVGGGAFTKEETELLLNLGISDKVIQKNVTDGELAYLYNHAVCFIYPSKYEGFGFPLLEAFDNSCPVICSNTSSLPEVGGDAAIYFSPDNEEELSDRIDMLLKDENIRNEFILRGRERVQLFSWEKTANETREFYEHILQKKGHCKKKCRYLF